MVVCGVVYSCIDWGCYRFRSPICLFGYVVRVSFLLFPCKIWGVWNQRRRKERWCWEGKGCLGLICSQHVHTLLLESHIKLTLSNAHSIEFLESQFLSEKGACHHSHELIERRDWSSWKREDGWVGVVAGTGVYGRVCEGNEREERGKHGMCLREEKRKRR